MDIPGRVWFWVSELCLLSEKNGKEWHRADKSIKQTKEKKEGNEKEDTFVTRNVVK